MKKNGVQSVSNTGSSVSNSLETTITENSSGSLTTVDEQITDIKNEQKDLTNKVDTVFHSLTVKAANVEERFNTLEKRMDETANRISNIAIGIIIVFAIAGFSIFIDYVFYNQKDSQDRYEKFSDKVNEIKEDFYSKDEIDKNNKQFKDCIWNNGLYKCLK